MCQQKDSFLGKRVAMFCVYSLSLLVQTKIALFLKLNVVIPEINISLSIIYFLCTAKLFIWLLGDNFVNDTPQIRAEQLALRSDSGGSILLKGQWQTRFI